MGKIANQLNVKEDYTALSGPINSWKELPLNVEEAGRKFSVTVKLHARCHQWIGYAGFERKEARGQGPHADPEGGKGKRTDSSRTSCKNEVLLSPLFQTSLKPFPMCNPSLIFIFLASNIMIICYSSRHGIQSPS